MSLTGLFLCSFLAVHLSGNLQLLKADNGLAFNVYAVFMTTFPLIKFISYGLYAIILYHAIMGLYLASKNSAARKSKYAVSAGNTTSFWASRWMGVLGTIILVFIAVHMSDFWAEYHWGHIPYVQYEIDLATDHTISVDTTIASIEAKKAEIYTQNTKIIIVKDLYREVQEAFKHPLLVLLYVFAMGAVAFHLVHGFKSAFQTLGINHSKYNGLIRFLGIWVFGIIIPVLFALIPVYIFIS
jgi:succinate dehydrogenase / fumarate reductase, cytochrome b subunit